MREDESQFRSNLNELVDATTFLSGSYLSHESAGRVLAYDGLKAVPWLLEYLRECIERPAQGLNPWVALEALSYFVSPEYLPHIPDHARGRLNKVLDIYEIWGVKKGMLLARTRRKRTV